MYLLAITDIVGGLPIWTWIVMAAIVLIAIIIIAVVAAKAVRTKKEINEEQKQQPLADAPQEAAKPEEQPVAQPVAEVAPKPEPRPEPAPVAEEKPAEAPVEVVRTTVAEKKPEAAAQPAKRGRPPKSQTAAAKPKPRPAPAARPASGTSAKVYHITKRAVDGKWQIKFSKGKKAIKLFETQAEAIEYARVLAQHQEASIMIHKEDGTFRKLRYNSKIDV